MRTRHAKAKIPLLGILATAVLCGGCGGPEVELGAGGEFSEPSAQITFAADSICREIARSFAEEQREAPRTFSQGAAITGRLVEIARDGEEQLAALEPPAGKEEAFELYLQARGEVVDELERARDAALSEDGDAYERARRAASDGASRRFKLAVRAGLDGCAKVERGRSDR